MQHHRMLHIGVAAAIAFTLAVAQAQDNDTPTVNGQVPGASVSGEDASPGARAREERPQTGTGADSTVNTGAVQDSDTNLDGQEPHSATESILDRPDGRVRMSDAWDRYDWAEVEEESYVGHFVDPLAYVSGDMEPEEGQSGPRAGDGVIAFVEDRSVLTELVTDTAHIAVFSGQSALESQAQEMTNQRVRVTAQKYERDGLNLINIRAIEPAPADAE